MNLVVRPVCIDIENLLIEPIYASECAFGVDRTLCVRVSPEKQIVLLAPEKSKLFIAAILNEEIVIANTSAIKTFVQLMLYSMKQDIRELREENFDQKRSLEFSQSEINSLKKLYIFFGSKVIEDLK